MKLLSFLLNRWNLPTFFALGYVYAQGCDKFFSPPASLVAAWGGEKNGGKSAYLKHIKHKKNES